MYDHVFAPIVFFMLPFDIITVFSFQDMIGHIQMVVHYLLFPIQSSVGMVYLL